MSHLQEIVPLIQHAKQVACFTGAGISTGSFIPDFRSKSGIYQHTPESILSKSFFFNHPSTFYEFLFKNLYFPNAEPNPGHLYLRKWEQLGKHVDIITQNIDGLHKKAGSENVIEFHGNIHTATCHNPKCNKTYSTASLYEKSKIDSEFYICDCRNASSRRFIKPDFVLFEERGHWMSTPNMRAIQRKVLQADVILVLGTKLNVYPFRSFIEEKPADKSLIIINKEEIQQQSLPHTYFIKNGISETLEELSEYL